MRPIVSASLLRTSRQVAGQRRPDRQQHLLEQVFPPHGIVGLARRQPKSAAPVLAKDAGASCNPEWSARRP